MITEISAGEQYKNRDPCSVFPTLKKKKVNSETMLQWENSNADYKYLTTIIHSNYDLLRK